MSPKARNIEISEDQGALFETHVIPSGVTDPALASRRVELELAPEGFYPDKIEPIADVAVEEDQTAAAALHRAVTRQKNHQSQTGRHSVLEEHGAYADLENNISYVKPGKVLPGFGIVFKYNLSAAEAHARKLETERRARQR